MGLNGAIVGDAVGGDLNLRFGRKGDPKGIVGIAVLPASSPRLQGQLRRISQEQA
jgi:hypothetical protein